MARDYAPIRHVAGACKWHPNPRTNPNTCGPHLIQDRKITAVDHTDTVLLLSTDVIERPACIMETIRIPAQKL